FAPFPARWGQKYQHFQRQTFRFVSSTIEKGCCSKNLAGGKLSQYQRVGAGEGNRTLVISLEDVRWLLFFRGYSDKRYTFGLLGANGNIRLLECTTPLTAPRSGRLCPASRTPL